MAAIRLRSWPNRSGPDARRCADDHGEHFGESMVGVVGGRYAGNNRVSSLVGGDVAA
jgi:hypothetical protein